MVIVAVLRFPGVPATEGLKSRRLIIWLVFTIRSSSIGTTNVRGETSPGPQERTFVTPVKSSPELAVQLLAPALTEPAPILPPRRATLTTPLIHPPPQYSPALPRR